MTRLYRVQDAEGRGPYRPGFSHKWSDLDGPVVLPWWTELGLPLAEALKLFPADMNGGSAFSSLAQLAAWFTEAERAKLDDLGYYIVRFRPHKIIAETPTQVVFAQNCQLAALPRFTSALASHSAARTPPGHPPLPSNAPAATLHHIDEQLPQREGLVPSSLHEPLHSVGAQ